MSDTYETVRVLGGLRDPVSVIREIVAGGLQEDPFYVLNLGEVVDRFRKWKKLMPRVEPFYAVKCNDDKLLVTTLAALGTGFDCASKAEIELVTSLGVRPERIIFANPAKMPSHIQHASTAGVHTMTFDSETELYKIKELFPHAKLVVRIRCDANDASYCLGAKYGCDAATDAPKLLVKAAMLGLEVIGVSFHIGSDCNECAAYDRGIRAARTVFDAAREAGHKELTLLDLGGGFPGRSNRGIEEHAAIINEALMTEFSDQSVRVIAEPGRYFATAPYTLAVMVHSKREVKDDTGKPHTQYYINDGIFGSFMEALFQPAVHPQLLKPSSAETIPSSIWGPTCDSSDCVMPSVSLPPLDVGDWIVFRDMGAYSLSLATSFNGFEAARPKAVVDRSLWPLLKELPPFVASQFIEDSVWSPGGTQKELNSTAHTT